jgi:hypothetical protein
VSHRRRDEAASSPGGWLDRSIAARVHTRAGRGHGRGHDLARRSDRQRLVRPRDPQRPARHARPGVMGGAGGPPFPQRRARGPVERHDSPVIAFAVADDQLAGALREADIVDLKRGELPNPDARAHQQLHDARSRPDARRSVSRGSARNCSRDSARAPLGSISTRRTAGTRSARESSSDVAAARARFTVDGASRRRRRREPRGGRSHPPAPRTPRARGRRLGARAARQPIAGMPCAFAAREPGGRATLRTRPVPERPRSPAGSCRNRQTAASDGCDGHCRPLRPGEVPLMAPCRNRTGPAPKGRVATPWKGGGGRIRTCEGRANGFTARPL